MLLVLKLNSQILELLKFKIPKGELLSIFFKIILILNHF